MAFYYFYIIIHFKRLFAFFSITCYRNTNRLGLNTNLREVIVAHIRIFKYEVFLFTTLILFYVLIISNAHLLILALSTYILIHILINFIVYLSILHIPIQIYYSTVGFITRLVFFRSTLPIFTIKKDSYINELLSNFRL